MEATRSFRATTILQLAVVSGLVALLLSVMGMVQAFSQRDIVARLISLGELLILSIILVFSSLAAGRSAGSAAPLRVLGGLLVGVVTELALVGLVVLGQQVNLRTVFPNISPALFETLQFGRAAPGSYLYMLGAGAVGGVAGSVLQLLPSRLRRAVVTGIILVATLGLLEDLIRITLGNMPAVAGATAWMFATGVENGLTTVGAAASFVVAGAISFYGRTVRSAVEARSRRLPERSRRGLGYGGLLVLLLLVLVLPQALGSIISDITNYVGIFLLMALGLNIVVGYAGLLDLGYVAFFAIGAYTMGVLTTTAIGPEAGQIVWGLGLTFWEALPFAVGLSILAGVLLGIPVLRMRGDYLAIVTLGFGEIVRILALSDFLKSFIGGSQGIVEVGVPTVASVVANTPQTLYYVIVLFAAVGVFITIRLRDSRLGRTWMAMREDEDVAQAMGIRLVPTKLLAFATGAALAGLAGAVSAARLGTVYPHSLNLLVSINVLSIVIIGGMGSIPGVIVGSLALIGLPELLREFSDFRYFVFGAVLIAMMLFRPEGLWPEAARRRELHEVPAAETEGAAVAEVSVEAVA